MDPHRFTFYRIGGLDQVAIETGADLSHLPELDQKLWVALSCPVRGLELDARTLELLDLDHDGRVRAPELLAALDWCKARLKSLGVLIPGASELSLSTIEEGTPEGRAILGAAKRVLAHLGKPEAQSILVADAADLSRVFAGSKLNGDGIVTPKSTDDAALSAAIADAIACAGSVQDRSGDPGIDQARLDAFFADLKAYAEWAQKPVEQPFGAATAELHVALKAIEEKAVEYFARGRLAAFDPAAAASAAAREANSEMIALPLARPDAGRPLPLIDGVNPAWADRLAAVSRAVNAPHLTEVDWRSLRERLTPFAAHHAAKAGAAVEKLGLPRVQELLGSGAQEAIARLIAEDASYAAEASAVADVERLVRYRRDLHRLTRNFVNFADFYDPQLSAVFQAGTLYLDSRSCELCIKVEDTAQHSLLASLSRMYIAYCECKRPGEKMLIAACFTQGDSDYLMVGRNGIFYDRQGRDWDAHIIKVIDNPISIRQAFLAPYKKFVRIIEEQALRFAASKEKEQDARLAATAEGVAAGSAPPAPVDVGKMVGIIAALGVGIGALGTVFGGLIAGFVSLQPWWAKLIAVAAVPLAISGPSMLLAFLKLRQRTLGPVLDGNGWAINGRIRVNLPLGAALTDIPHLPEGSRRSLDDPFEDTRARRRRRLLWTGLVLLVIAYVAWRWYLFFATRH
jgi:hypothetical protein